jgi:predicted DNA-binding transcriptional regulator AlpA
MKQQTTAYDPDDRFISANEVTRLTSLSRSTLNRMVEGNRFPAPYQLGPARLAWSHKQVRSWMQRVSGGTADAD